MASPCSKFARQPAEYTVLNTEYLTRLSRHCRAKWAAKASRICILGTPVHTAATLVGS